MASRTLAAAALLATAVLVGGLGGALVEPQDLVPGLVGSWTPPQAINANAIHAALLPTGKVLLWQGQNNVKLWDPATAALQQANLGGDKTIFCGGQTLLPDGRVLVVSGLGGQGGSSQGHPRTHLFDPWTGTWARGPDMAAGRWYPGVVALPDGRALAMGGLDETADLNNRVEAFDGTAWLDLDADRNVGTFPRLLVLPSGEVLKAGPGPIPLFFDPDSLAWREGPAAPGGARGGGGAVLLPGLDKVLVFGGAQAGTVKASAEVLDLATMTWSATGSMALPRVNLNPVLLADGSVMAFGGAPVPNKFPSGYAPERYDPATGLWQLMAPEQRGRTYHSTALLLPDGRVAVMGSDVEGVAIDTGDGPPLGVPATNGRTLEVFSPPYLFQGPRPLIAEAPQEVGYGAAFEVASPEAADVARVAVVRLGATTHSVNFDQRYVDLVFTAEGSALQVTGPASADHAPPGWYMLFLVSEDGVPSVAKMVHVA